MGFDVGDRVPSEGNGAREEEQRRREGERGPGGEQGNEDARDPHRVDELLREREKRRARARHGDAAQNDLTARRWHVRRA